MDDHPLLNVSRCITEQLLTTAATCQEHAAQAFAQAVELAMAQSKHAVQTRVSRSKAASNDSGDTVDDDEPPADAKTPSQQPMEPADAR